MAKWGTYKTVAGNNNSAPPDGWPEGQAPSTVNDCAREMMAQTAIAIANLEYLDLGHVPTFVNATSFTIASQDLVNFTPGRRLKLGDGANTIYATVASVSATLVICQLDASPNQLVFDSSLTSVALSVIRPDNSSLPENSWKRRNVIINGNMEIWQRSATFAIPNSGAVTYTADRWSAHMSLSANTACNISRFERSANASAVPTVLQCGALLDSSLIVSVSAISSTVGAAQWAKIRYVVEGYDFRQIAQRPMNLSFWVNTRQSGIYAVAMRNTAADRSFVQNYTISAIGVWTRFSISIPKSPAAGTWDYSAGVGLEVDFTLAAGSTYQGGAGNWTAANLLATSSQVNFFQSAGNTFAITGVQLETGQFATPLEVRQYNAEKEMCKRYHQCLPDETGTTPGFIGAAFSTSQAIFTFNIPEMRAVPVATYPAVNPGAPFTVSNQVNTPFSVSAVNTQAAGLKVIQIQFTAVGTPFTAGQGSNLIFAAGTPNVIHLDAEL